MEVFALAVKPDLTAQTRVEIGAILLGETHRRFSAKLRNRVGFYPVAISAMTSASYHSFTEAVILMAFSGYPCVSAEWVVDCDGVRHDDVHRTVINLRGYDDDRVQLMGTAWMAAALR